MNTYRAIRVESGHWAIEWWVKGVRKSLVWGWFATEGEALFAACDLATMEFQEGIRSAPFDHRRQRSA